MQLFCCTELACCRRGSGGSLGSLHSVDERSAFNAVEPRVEPRSARDAVGVVVEEGPGNGAAAGHESSPDNMQVSTRCRSHCAITVSIRCCYCCVLSPSLLLLLLMRSCDCAVAVTVSQSLHALPDSVSSALCLTRLLRSHRWIQMRAHRVTPVQT